MRITVRVGYMYFVMCMREVWGFFVGLLTTGASFRSSFIRWRFSRASGRPGNETEERARGLRRPRGIGGVRPRLRVWIWIGLGTG